jgi:hypothetical protein
MSQIERFEPAATKRMSAPLAMAGSASGPPRNMSSEPPASAWIDPEGFWLSITLTEMPSAFR